MKRCSGSGDGPTKLGISHKTKIKNKKKKQVINNYTSIYQLLILE